MSKSSGKVFLAGLFGALAGAVGGLLFAPKSGKETREDISKLARRVSKSMQRGVVETEDRVKKIFGESTKSAVEKYKKISGAVSDKVVAVKGAGKEIDKEKYSAIVDEVVESFKQDFVKTKTGAVKMAEQLKRDWEKVKKALV